MHVCNLNFFAKVRSVLGHRAQGGAAGKESPGGAQGAVQQTGQYVSGNCCRRGCLTQCSLKDVLGVLEARHVCLAVAALSACMVLP